MVQWRQEVLPHWTRDRGTKQVRALVAAGVPAEVRPMVWRAAVGNSLAISRSRYEELLSEVSQRKREDAQASAKGDEQPGQTPRHLKTRGLIARDLGRTCSGVGGAFAVEGSIEQNELRQVLEALSFFNSEFGYVHVGIRVTRCLRHGALRSASMLANHDV